MASHTITFGSGLEGPQTDVGLDVGVRHAPWGGPPCTRRALLDTGATATTVSPAIRQALRPMKIGRARVHLPGLGVVWNDTYFVPLQVRRAEAKKGRWFGLEIKVVALSERSQSSQRCSGAFGQRSSLWFWPRAGSGGTGFVVSAMPLPIGGDTAAHFVDVLFEEGSLYTFLDGKLPAASGREGVGTIRESATPSSTTVWSQEFLGAEGR